MSDENITRRFTPDEVEQARRILAPTIAPTTPLAQMSPDALRAEHDKFGVSLHALIQRATREATERVNVLHTAQLDIANKVAAHHLRERDEARAQLAEAERKLADIARAIVALAREAR